MFNSNQFTTLLETIKLTADYILEASDEDNRYLFYLKWTIQKLEESTPQYATLCVAFLSEQLAMVTSFVNAIEDESIQKRWLELLSTLNSSEPKQIFEKCRAFTPNYSPITMFE